jgi:hypothetical protein
MPDNLSERKGCPGVEDETNHNQYKFTTCLAIPAVHNFTSGI